MVDNQPTHVGITALDAAETSCRRSTREKRKSTRYYHDEFILLTNMREPEYYDEVILDANINKWKELIVDNHEICRSVAGRKPVKSYFTLSSFGLLAGRGVCWAIAHVPCKGPWFNPT